jgi:hypothetical protein
MSHRRRDAVKVIVEAVFIATTLMTALFPTIAFLLRY